MTTHTTVTRIGPLTIQRINSSQNSLAAGDVDDQPICDDGSILLSACQSFFGKEDHDPPPLQGNTDTNNNNDGVEAVGSPSQQDHSNKQQLSTALPNITLPECSSSNSLFQNNSRVLHSRARSMSPSLTTNTAAATDDLDLFYNCSPTYYNGGSEESDTTVMSNNWSTSYFETSDFNAQTWVDLVQETETIRYCGAGEWLYILLWCARRYILIMIHSLHFKCTYRGLCTTHYTHITSWTCLWYPFTIYIQEQQS